MNIKSLSIFMISAMMCGLLTSCGKTGNDEVVTEPVEIEEDVLPLEAVEDPLEATEDPLGKTEEPQEISKELQHDLNIFLSNFSEQGYNCAGYDPAEWAHFTLEWKILNDPSGLKYENDRTWIDQSSVNNIEYEDYGVSTTYYSLTAAEADKLADEGRIIPKATGVAIIDDVVSNGYGDSYWLDDYNILE
ncbi:hypothetical protein [Butyrivibrio sp. INlla16]|uniref:hypothetical protein n=1 Tax=Butyrivibrio sp. INlla16 TaxID=1520807 RepID=UPI00088465B5|nr:hypothetical protein [Butyrivibrio sp. INlla16]SDB62001.1 hypothetical protein SAMN02910263_03330 [Butyrivibrio sp. INlla16]